jgi:uncharacterized protein YyaL (SSP411 family)
LVEAFTRLAEATGQARWIAEGRAVADAMLELFWDHEGGALFTTGHDAEQLVARQKDLLDKSEKAAASEKKLSDKDKEIARRAAGVGPLLRHRHQRADLFGP